MEKPGIQTDGYHIACPVVSTDSLNEYRDTVLPGSYVGQLVSLLVPWSLRKYPGKRIAGAEALGVPVSVLRQYARAGGNSALTANVARRGEKICRDMAAKFQMLACQFADHAAKRESERAPKRRGFLAVRVRDESGIPRNAQIAAHVVAVRYVETDAVDVDVGAPRIGNREVDVL